ncbi:MAG: LamG domain-containing protein, partial [Gammaproteobacteria bacterium]|nr:LamG domain-containing protein [Gammaproteobacteria bacterium]
EQGVLNCGSDAAIDDIFEGGGTIMLWGFFRDFGLPEFGDFARLFDKSGTAETIGYILFMESDGASDFHVQFNVNLTVDDGVWESDAGAFDLDEWVHIAMTWDSDTAPGGAPLLYKNGVLVDFTQSGTNTGDLVSDAGAELLIGNRTRQDAGVDGFIADVRMYDEILSASAIRNIFASKGADPNLGSLVRRWPLSPLVPGVGVKTPWLDQVETAKTANNQDTYVLTNATSSDGDALVMIVAVSGAAGTASVLSETGGNWDLIFTEGTQTAGTSTPSVALWTKVSGTPSTEPGTYTVETDNSDECYSGVIFNMGTMSPDLVGSVGVTTGSSASPSCPSNTPGENVLTFRVVCMDAGFGFQDRPYLMWLDLPVTGLHRDFVNADTGHNGANFSVAIEAVDGSASGTRVHNPAASEQWVGVTASFGYGDGTESPATDHGPDKSDGFPSYPIVGAADILRIKG